MITRRRRFSFSDLPLLFVAKTDCHSFSQWFGMNRVDGKVVTLALMIAHGVSSSGSREILAIEPMFDESEDSWRVFFGKLKRRGLKRVCLCISDAHAGIQAAVRKELLGTSWQRCKVHFMRNILAKVPHKEKRRFAAHLKQIWLQPDRKSARRAADQLAQE